MDAKQALDEVSYLKYLLEDTRERIGKAWVILIVWGAALVASGVVGTLFESRRFEFHGNLGFAIFILVFLASLAILALLGITLIIKRSGPPNILSKRLLLINVLLVCIGAILPLLFAMSSTIQSPDAATVQVELTFLLPLWIGVLLVVNGVFVSPVLLGVGLFELIVALVAPTLDLETSRIFIPLASGAGLFVAGLVVRRYRSRGA